MQLDRANVYRMEVNGMILAVVAVYDLDSDETFYEVSKTLAGKQLNMVKAYTLASAYTAYSDMAKEAGASVKDIYNSKIK